MATRLSVYPLLLKFKEEAVTSRNTMLEKPTWIMRVESPGLPGGEALGEVAMFDGLSAEDSPEFETILQKACRDASGDHSLADALQRLPKISSIIFGFESALLRAGCFPTTGKEQPWLRGEEGIRINGLIWMGNKQQMLDRLKEKLRSGFHCIKLKIGGIDFDQEVALLRSIRNHFSPGDIEIRLDANGSFTPENALARLSRLAPYHIHSIEQPIRQNQWEQMAAICRESPIPVALDEELIGFTSAARKQQMLDTIRPQYIILKPSLCGGFSQAQEWIEAGGELGIGWWATSALESNIGLEAIARWTASLSPDMPQGLGTGALYTNNTPSTLVMRGEYLWNNP